MLTALLFAPVLLLGCGAQPPTNVGATGPDIAATASTVGEQTTSDVPGTTFAPVVTEPARTETSVTATVGTSNPSTQLYTTITTVIDRPGSGPKLCLAGQLESAPPICGDVPVLGLGWAAVTGALHSGNVTWMERALVTGTYDGSSLTLTEPPRLATDAEFSSAFDHRNGPIPCPEPADGWQAEGARFPSGSEYNEYIQRVDDYTSGAPDWGGAWVEFGDSPIDIASHPEKVILVELFTDDLARHETDLLAIWPGSVVCRPVDDGLQQDRSTGGENLSGRAGRRQLGSGDAQQRDRRLFEGCDPRPRSCCEPIDPSRVRREVWTWCRRGRGRLETSRQLLTPTTMGNCECIAGPRQLAKGTAECLAGEDRHVYPGGSPSARRLDGSVGGSGLVTISEFGDPGIPPVLA